MMNISQIIKKAGGCVKLANALGIRHSAPLQWKRVPDKRLVDVSRITGIPVDELRPDLAQIFKERVEG